MIKRLSRPMGIGRIQAWVFGLSCFLLMLAPAFSPLAAQVLRRDSEFGRIFIWSGGEYRLYEAYGYGTAQDRLWQLEFNRHTAKGTLAEILGQNYIFQDRVTRRESYTDAEYWELFDSLPEWVRVAFQGYADGINRYLRDAATAVDRSAWLPWEFYYLGYMPSLWDVTDSLAILRSFLGTFGESNAKQLSNLTLYRFLVERYGAERGAAIFNDLHWMNDPDSPVTVPTGDPGSTQIEAPAAAFKQVHTEVYLDMDMEAVQRAAEAAAREEADLRALREALGFPPKLGSYAFVANGNKSASGKPMLFGGPQMMVYPSPDVVHDVYLKTILTPFNPTTPRINVAGIGVAGGPVVVIGHTDRLAWSLTSGIGNNIDTFIETVRPHPSVSGKFQYLHKGRWLDMEARTEVYKYRTSPIPGPLEIGREERSVVYRTIHGPVFQPATLAPDTTLAFANQRAHWKKDGETLIALMGINRARTLDEVERNVLRISGSLNVIYADVDGNIAYWQSGRIPVRAPGTDIRLPMRGTGEDEWQPRYWPIPHSRNPRQGFMANWNNKPAIWFDTNGDTFFGKQFRVSRLIELLDDPTLIPNRPADRDPIKLSIEDFRAIEQEIARVPPTGYRRPFVLRFLLQAINDMPDGDSRKNKLKAAGELLSSWDGYTIDNAISSQFTNPADRLFERCIARAIDKVFTPWLGSYTGSHASFNALVHVLEGGASSVPPSHDYIGDRSWKDVLTDSLWETMAELTETFQTDDMSQWRSPRALLRFPHTLCLFNPAVCAIGPPIPASNRSTYSQVIHLDKPVQAMNVLPSGQSGFLGYDLNNINVPILGPHMTDQRALFGAFEFKPTLLY
ncbi:MAG: penicillin acylase family protein [Acidobacteria bacterium]|nr:penicillin acylase family protein [Acidobacteriota bacterium]